MTENSTQINLRKKTKKTQQNFFCIMENTRAVLSTRSSNDIIKDLFCLSFRTNYSSVGFTLRFYTVQLQSLPHDIKKTSLPAIILSHHIIWPKRHPLFQWFLKRKQEVLSPRSPSKCVLASRWLWLVCIPISERSLVSGGWTVLIDLS